MPEMHFLVRWPDGGQLRCYSPSLVVREYLEVGRSYPLRDFLERSRTMLQIGSERVRAKYGFACSAALDQLAVIEAQGEGQDQEGQVTVLGFELPAGAEAASPAPNPGTTTGAGAGAGAGDGVGAGAGAGAGAGVTGRG